jgi:PBSX family phage portal protein
MSDDDDVRRQAAEVAHRATDELNSERVSVTIVGQDRVRKSRARARKADGSLAHVADSGSMGTLAIAFQVPGLVQPPYDPRMLCRLHEHSNSLRQNVDSYATNIDGFGHHFEPQINLDADDAREKVREAMYLDTLLSEAGGDPIKVKEPADGEVEDKIAELKRMMRVEHASASSFFEFCCVDMAFVTLRRRTRSDLEITGNAYWEVIRNKTGRPAQFVFMPSHSVRLVAKDSVRVEIEQVVQRGPITFAKEKVQRTFRRYVQSAEGTATVWFKELGDPRSVSSKTGTAYATPEQLAKEEPSVAPANEVIHFVVHASTSPYGVPRWIGNLLSVLGSRNAEEVNYLYFENKTIPPLAILVSGGRMGSDSVARIQSFIDTEIKGKRNFHKVLILEAETNSAAAMMGLENAGRCRIEIKPLTEAHLKDALFQEYDERNIDKVGMSFRLPRLLRGDIRDFNRASAQAALEFAESQVFGPERTETDFTINRMILPALGIKYWKFLSDGPRITDPKDMAAIIAQLTVAGVLVPKDGRELAEDRVFYRKLTKIIADWTEQPIPLTAAGFPLDVSDDQEIPGPGGAVKPQGEPAKVMNGGAARKRRLVGTARRLIELRDELSEAEAEEAARELRTAKRQSKRAARVEADDDDDADAEVIKMPATEMRDRFGVG